MSDREANIITTLISLIFLIIGIGIVVYPKIAYEETTGVITGIHSKTTQVRYAVGDHEYTGSVNFHSAFYKVGQTITVYYDPEHPAKPHGDTPILGYAFIGLIIFITFIRVLIYLNGKKKPDDTTPKLPRFET